MADQDPARFDYLFEPIGGDTESAGNGDVGVLVDVSTRSAPTPRWPWFVVVAATIILAGVALVALWTSPVDAVQSPSSGASTTAPPKPVTSAPEIVLPPTPSATLLPAATPVPEPTSDVVPSPAFVPRPAQAPTESAPAARPPSPTVRSPMSVSPTPRPAFPNQKVPDGDGNRGGLLGRGGLL